MNNTELIFVPAPGIGHLLSSIEFAKRLLHRHPTFLITVLVIKLPSAPTVPFEPVSDTSRIRYLHLPQLDPPEFTGSGEVFFTAYIDSYKLLVRDVITDHLSSKSSSEPVLAGLVLDLFCTAMVDVAKDLGVPSYIYFTSSAEFLGYMLYLPIRQDLVGAEFTESEPDCVIPSYINPVPASALPGLSFNKQAFNAFLNHARNFKETKGIIVNTFAELESHAVSSLASDYGHVPPVYTVGPVLDLNGRKHGRGRDKIMKWLDDQPPSSVAFLCFGSFGRFSVAQVREIANGLGRSGARYLWSLRKAPPNRWDYPNEYSDEELEEILPREILESVAGMVCGWAPQAEVLAHRAVGGFVSHCGWNSILESLWFGVPIATWPMYAEQQVNAFELVRDLGLAVELKLDYRMDGGDVVAAEEVERAVRCVMDDESEVRKRVKEMSENSRRAVVEGGSSYESLGRLIQDMLNIDTL